MMLNFIVQSSPWIYEQRSMVAQRRRMQRRARCSLTKEVHLLLKPYPFLFLRTLTSSIINIENQYCSSKANQHPKKEKTSMQTRGDGLIYIYREREIKVKVARNGMECSVQEVTCGWGGSKTKAKREICKLSWI